MTKRTPEEAINKLAEDVRKTYFWERRNFYMLTRGYDTGYMPNRDAVKNWDGGTDRRGVRHTSIWVRIVRFALKNRVDPVNLVRALFFGRSGSRTPLPNEALTDAALDKLATFQVKEVEDIKTSFSLFNEEAAQAFAIKKDHRPDAPHSTLWREIISDDDRTFTPLFRFCFAASMDMSDVADYFRKDALLEYLQSPEDYNNLLGKFLPADFREESARLGKLMGSR